MKTKAWAYAAGAIIGGIIPSITWDISHHQVEARPMLWLAVAGGLAYSAPMIALWFNRYAGTIKAWGFVLSLEVADLHAGMDASGSPYRAHRA